MQVVPLLGQRNDTAPTLHWSSAAFKGLTAMTTESRALHHALFLRDRALRLTCGPWGRSASRYKCYRKTHTHQGLLFSFPWFTLSCCYPLPWCFTHFSPRSQKRFYSITAYVFLSFKGRAAVCVSVKCTVNAQFTFKHLLFFSQICPPLWTHCFGFWSTKMQLLFILRCCVSLSVKLIVPMSFLLRSCRFV